MSHHFLRFTDVHYTYPNGYEALKGVDFFISHGEKVALLGLNGAGKSTVLLHTNGLLLPTSGEVNVGGIPVTKKTLRTVRQSVGMVFQNADDQLFMSTVEEDVAFGPLNMGLEGEEVERRVSVALEMVGASDLRSRSPFRLSGGQKKRVAIATVLSMEPSILVMDEPTSELDLEARRQVCDIVRAFHHTCLIATHDMALARELCERAIIITDGRVTADGPVDEITAQFEKTVAHN
ncbi:MAG: energy-coupling factor ABC transporter ATP-binding protein [Muribaculaceae bacterium]|nr:energy-coupling factor ABC transporter ATP-binding protein [Muribaculaceae bacterium]